MTFIRILFLAITFWYLHELYIVFKFEIVRKRVLSKEKLDSIKDLIEQMDHLSPTAVKVQPIIMPSLVWVLKRRKDEQAGSSST